MEIEQLDELLGSIQYEAYHKQSFTVFGCKQTRECGRVGVIWKIKIGKLLSYPCNIKKLINLLILKNILKHP